MIIAGSMQASGIDVCGIDASERDRCERAGYVLQLLSHPVRLGQYSSHPKLHMTLSPLLQL